MKPILFLTSLLREIVTGCTYSHITRVATFNIRELPTEMINQTADAGEENDNCCYVVTEHVHGARTLASYCKPDNLLRVDDVVEIMFKCARALNYAHSRGVIHRDIKPSNIMLKQAGVPMISDFGLAIEVEDRAIVLAGEVGTPYYMSPEQISSEKIGLDRRTDIFSLGATLYELLTLQHPFEGLALPSRPSGR